VFLVSVVVVLALATAVAIELGRLAYARSEVAKAADAAALAAASRVNVAVYRDTGQIVFLPDVYAYAGQYANDNSTYLTARSIRVSVTGIRINAASHTVAVSVSADLSPVLPGLLSGAAHFTITGYAQARVDGR
jgi:Flp pilus assembly protein TadG